MLKQANKGITTVPMHFSWIRWKITFLLGHLCTYFRKLFCVVLRKFWIALLVLRYKALKMVHKISMGGWKRSHVKILPFTLGWHLQKSSKKWLFTEMLPKKKYMTKTCFPAYCLKRKKNVCQQLFRIVSVTKIFYIFSAMFKKANKNLLHKRLILGKERGGG
jgi:hypothetical protein